MSFNNFSDMEEAMKGMMNGDAYGNDDGMEEYTRLIASVLDEDGNLIYDGPDPTCRKYCVLAKKAKKYELQELALLLPELVCALHSKNAKALSGSCLMAIGCAPPATPRECIARLVQHCEWVEKALSVFEDRKIARLWSRKDQTNMWILTMLGPKSKFDMGHEMHQMQSNMMKAMQQGNNKNTSAIADFQESKFQEFMAEQPIDKYLRTKETGFKAAARYAAQLTDAEEANACGKQAWTSNKKWAAELYWERATQLNGSEAKYYSNLAHVRVHLGRFLRSYHLGYRELAAKMLEQAVKDAETATELDPTFSRAYQRWAEALLALGSHDRAMQAYRVLTKANQAIGDLSAPLVLLQETAKINARRWLPVAASSSSGASIPKTLYAALANLRSAVVASLADDDDTTTEEDTTKQAADKIVDAVWTMRGALQLVYMRRNQWEREIKQAADAAGAVTDITQVEKELRQVAKVIPLRAVEQCEELKQLIFMQDPWMLWGLDHLDRKCVSYLEPEANDPCSADKLEGESAQFRELLQRSGGGGGMGMGEVNQVLEHVAGKGPQSFEQDMSSNTLAALQCGVLQRLILAKDCALSSAASQRVIELYHFKNGNGLWAGGEFLGMCMNCASGIGKYDAPEDAARTADFMRLEGGIASMAKEITQSQDNHEYYQKALATISPQDWASLDLGDILPALRDFIIAAMDEVGYLNPTEAAPYVATILSAMLDGVPDTLTMFRTGVEPDDLYYSNFRGIFMVLKMSAFGVFLIRRFESYEQRLKDEGQESPTTKDVVSLMIQKWLKLSKDKRSAYRWESFDDDTKKELAHMAPVDKAELMTQSKENKAGPSRSIPKAPECAYCGQKEGCGVVLLHCPCRAVKYCAKSDCQKLDRKNHKKLCKQLLSGK